MGRFEKEDSEIKEDLKEALIELFLWQQGLIKLDTRHIDVIIEELCNDEYVKDEDTEEIKQLKADMRIKFDKDKEFEPWCYLVEHVLDDEDDELEESDPESKRG